MSAAPPPARLLVSLLSGSQEPCCRAVQALVARMGPLIWWSQPLPFTWTDYYEPEMGAGLVRRLAAFQRLVEPQGLAGVKGLCQEVEAGLSHEGRRRVNLDPGLLSKDSLVLATHKYSGHRLALAPGVYGEVTLYFAGGQYRPLPWTYPDYAGQEMRGLLLVLRRRYLWQLSQERRTGGVV
ncbi:MAG: DUF4416 family protein [Desulfarculus sp.]|nr:MAG: DUF4416 family protein [Desulfarculus sp.]